jgi:uncharacterized protein (DUF952 family)
MTIYHIVLPDSWAAQKEKEFYEHESLRTEGFIHCSYAGQLDAVLGRYYSGAERVMILHIDPELLTSKLVAEASTGGEIYPHIYGKINRGAIVEISERTGIV